MKKIITFIPVKLHLTYPLNFIKCKLHLVSGSTISIIDKLNYSKCNTKLNYYFISSEISYCIPQFFY